MLIIRGKYTEATIFTDFIEETAQKQILNLCNQEAFRHSKIAIMPDCHAGAGCVIGFTGNLGGKVVPNLIGVDVGCGVTLTTLGKIDIDFTELDKFIRNNIPLNMNIRDTEVSNVDFTKFEEVASRVGCDLDRMRLSLGTLGGGNHYIEINKSKDNTKYLNIHTGSRNLGHKIATYHQKIAVEYCDGKGIDKNLAYLEHNKALDYLHDMEIAQEYASLNREYIKLAILKHLHVNPTAETIESVHNYLDFKSNIIRKGAISAKYDEKVVIPLNMRDGIIYGIGLGNVNMNDSAPHGAGRLMSRSQAKQDLTLEAYQDSMDGIFTTSVSESTLDESPFAYKPSHEIVDKLDNCVKIIEILKPIYNLKG